RLLQDTDVLLHAREGHMELLGKVRYRSVRTSEPLQNAASGGVRERGKRGIQVGSLKLNHWVQYIMRIGGMQREVERGLHRPSHLHSQARLPGRRERRSERVMCAFSAQSRDGTARERNTRCVYHVAALSPSF